jgi:hypothetical protein
MERQLTKIANSRDIVGILIPTSYLRSLENDGFYEVIGEHDVSW